jgi:hypothetical protein
LHGDRVAPADGNSPNLHGSRRIALNFNHGFSYVQQFRQNLAGNCC